VRRVLSIDGGGIMGAWPAAFLADIEEATGQRIVDTFDLIAGTSTGGIIALGVGLGIPPSEIVRFYERRGQDIFEPPGIMEGLRRKWRASRRLRVLCSFVDEAFGTIRHVAGPKLASDPLRAALIDVFGERVLGESQTRLVVPSFNPQLAQLYLFKTAHHPRFERDHLVAAVDVAMATAAAPTYFPAHTLQAGSVLVDGGIWANNPAGLATVEAVSTLGWAPDEVRLLSLGCTDQPLALPRRLSGRWSHLLNVIELMMRGQAEGSLGTAKITLCHSECSPRLFRRSPVVQRDTFKLDAAGQVSKLAGLGREDARQFLPTYRRVFMCGPREPFVPFHGARASLEPADI
jgi:predicted acylesterase/phospholipase RssA